MKPSCNYLKIRIFSPASGNLLGSIAIYGNAWTGMRVLERLGAAFIARPGLAVYSEGPTHYEYIAGPIDGVALIAAAATVLGHRSELYVKLIERARAEASDLDVIDLCAQKSWRLRSFYEQTGGAARKIACYLNSQDAFKA